MKQFPQLMQTENIGDTEVTAPKLSTASRDRTVVVQLNLNSTSIEKIISVDTIPYTVMQAETRVNGASVSSTGDAVVTLYNGAPTTSPIGTITIGSTAAQHEKDTMTTPHVTNKVIAAGGYIVAKVSTAATTSGVVDLTITLQPSEP